MSSKYRACARTLIDRDRTANSKGSSVLGHEDQISSRASCPFTFVVNQAATYFLDCDATALRLYEISDKRRNLTLRILVLAA